MNKVYHIAVHDLNYLENGYHWVLDSAGLLEQEVIPMLSQRVKIHGKSRVKVLLELPFEMKETIKIVLGEE